MTRIATTLVTGLSAGMREAAIAAALAAQLPQPVTALLLEGLPDGTSLLEQLAPSHPHLAIVRIAPGCICCTGNLTMRVSLNRILRTHPQQLFISLASAEHLPQIRQFLLQEPYSAWLSLTKEIMVNSRSNN